MRKKASPGMLAAILAVTSSPGCGMVLFIAIVLLGVSQAAGLDLFGNSGGSGAMGDAGIRDTTCTSPLYTNIKDEAAYAQAINELIPKESPLSGLGAAYVSGAKAAGVNPAFVYAISRKESIFGTAGIATKGTQNAFGRTATKKQPSIVLCGKSGCIRWYQWASWSQSLSNSDKGYEDEPSYIKRRYIDKGLTTIKDIMYTYAPPSENDTNGYIAEVYSWINALVARANQIKPGAVECK